MQAALAAYQNLIAIAEVDGPIGAHERALIERYRRALRVPRRFASAQNHPDVVSLGSIDGSAEQRRRLVSMMIRVAFADEQVTERERQHLVSTAESLGVSRVEYADLFVEVEQTTQHRQSVRRAILVGAGAIALILIVSLFIPPRSPSPGPGSGLGHRANAESTQSKSPGTSSRFAAIERQSQSAVMLIVVEYTLVRGGERLRRRGSGTGFVATADGWVITSKHVLEPWKFLADPALQLRDGFQVEMETVAVSAWPAGAKVFDAGGQLDSLQGFSTANDTLDYGPKADDRWQEVRRRTGDGRMVKLRLHTLDESDLATVKLTLKRPIEPLELSDPTHPVGTFDAVMLLGFPGGTQTLEGPTAALSHATGEVLRVERSIFIDAPIMVGNSGGPLIAADGRVVGIAARSQGNAQMGCCIQVRHALTLLPAARELATLAASFRESPKLRAATVRLARLRHPDGATRRQLDRLE